MIAIETPYGAEGEDGRESQGTVIQKTAAPANFGQPHGGRLEDVSERWLHRD